MKIRIYPDHPSLPIGPASGLVGSAMPLAIVGVPYGATSVDIAAFNADGIACNLSAAKMGGEWVTTVPASHFTSYGVISRGLQISVTFKDAAGVSQTVLFVGDMRIEAAAPGDPAGHGVPSVPITEVAEVPDGSPMKDIRDTVNQLARIVSGTATALALAFHAFGATPLEEIPGTNEVYTAAETDTAISNAISSLPPSGVTSNDVANIVTNEKFSSWIVLRDGIDVTSRLTQPEWKHFAFRDTYGWSRPILPGEQGEDFEPAIVTAGTGYAATGLLWVGEDPGSFQAFVYTATRTSINALGLARIKDLDDKTTAASVTNVVRDLSLGGIWDPDIEVWWTPRMRGGSLTYEATTNVNLNAGN